jgi:hypothetical protein
LKRKEEQETRQAPIENVPRFTKNQFLQSRQRSGRDRDILAVVLADGEQYTVSEAERAMENYLKRSVQ